jgi:hypothetical protein
MVHLRGKFLGSTRASGFAESWQGLADVEDPVVDLFSAETAAALALTDYLAGNELDLFRRWCANVSIMK